MAKICNINSTHDSRMDKCIAFDIQQQEFIRESSPDYLSVLNIFRNVFSLVDMNQIIRQTPTH